VSAYRTPAFTLHFLYLLSLVLALIFFSVYGKIALVLIFAFSPLMTDLALLHFPEGRIVVPATTEWTRNTSDYGRFSFFRMNLSYFYSLLIFTTLS